MVPGKPFGYQNVLDSNVSTHDFHNFSIYPEVFLPLLPLQRHSNCKTMFTYSLTRRMICYIHLECHSLDHKFKVSSGLTMLHNVINLAGKLLDVSNEEHKKFFCLTCWYGSFLNQTIWNETKISSFINCNFPRRRTAIPDQIPFLFKHDRIPC